MQIIRISNNVSGATAARLVMTSSSNGRIKATFKVEGPMSSFVEQSEYQSTEQAESAALAYAEHRCAVCLIIEDRT
jgi:hypothetical protein